MIKNDAQKIGEEKRNAGQTDAGSQLNAREEKEKETAK